MRWRKTVVLGTALVFAAVWFAGPGSHATAGGTAWIFKPSYSSYVSYDPHQAAKALWRQRVFYGGTATSHAIYGYNRTHVRFGQGQHRTFTGSSSHHRWESFFRVTTGGY